MLLQCIKCIGGEREACSSRGPTHSLSSWPGGQLGGLHHDHDGGDLDNGGDGGDNDGDGDGAAGRQPLPLTLNETTAATYNPCSVTNANTNRQRKANTSNTHKCIF